MMKNSDGANAKKDAGNNSRNDSRTDAKTTQTDTDTRFREFFIDSLKDIYWAEKALQKSLPKLMKAASCRELKQAFEKHLDETCRQIESVEQVFEMMGEKARGKKCEAMEGLLQEAASMVEDTEHDTCTRDAGLILAAQKVEHYEIATYGTLVAFARQMGENKVADRLKRILAEEKSSDQLLTRIAEGSVNLCAIEE